MNFDPILIVAGEPNSIFSEILFKTLNKIKIKKPIVLIASNKLLNLQKKKMNFKKSIKLLDHRKLNQYKLNNKSINLIDIKYDQKKPFEKISNKSNKYIKNCFKIAFEIIKKEINKEDEIKNIIEKKTNNQLNLYSNIYLNKIKKTIQINEL